MMEHWRQKQSEQCLEEVRKLFLMKNAVMFRIDEEVLINKEITEKLAQLHQIRRHEKLKRDFGKDRIQYMKKMEAARQIHAIKEEIEMARKRRNMDKFLKTLEDEQAICSTLAVELRRGEQLALPFLQRYREMPWILEKDELRRVLDYEEDRLTRIYEEISNIDRIIAGIRGTLARHEERPFEKMCIALADYKRKSVQLDKLIRKELKINEEYRQKLKICRRQPNMSILQETLNSTVSEFQGNVTPQLTTPNKSNMFTPYQSHTTKVRFGEVRMKSLSPFTDDKNVTTSESYAFNSGVQFIPAINEHNNSQDEYGLLPKTRQKQQYSMNRGESEIQQVICGNYEEMNSFNVDFDAIDDFTFNLPLTEANLSLNSLQFNFKF